MTAHHKKHRIVFLGPPASGKGTQAAHMMEVTGAVQLSTGEILREAVAKGDERGKHLKATMDAGQLVADELIISLITSRIFDTCRGNGFILDGFPRTINQASILDGILSKAGEVIDFVIELVIDDDLLVKRCLGRLVHPPSGRSYHVEFCPPKVPMTDDVTGEPLVCRSDDNEETLRKRLATYHQQTEPVSEYYNKKGILFKIDASKNPSQIWTDIEKIINPKL